jgi:peptidoglycan LD-endopeptidase CwlK
MTFTLSLKSEHRLQGVHPDLVRVVRRALELTSVDFAVTEGLRTKERQAELVAKGASQTMNSRHLTGHAVDLAAVVGGEIRWDWPLYDKLAQAMKSAAGELNIPIVWGGDWKTLRDGPHFELDRRSYPA